MKKDIILFGAGLIGKKAINYFGSSTVLCFVDNFKAGTFYCGKNVISFEDLLAIKGDYRLILTLASVFMPSVEEQCLSNNIEYSVFYDLIDIDDFDSNPELHKYKDMYKGKRGFVIGNGPSLRAADLDVIHNNNMVSLASNRIYKIFDKTKWRPDIFFISDDRMIALDKDVIPQLVDIRYKLIANLLSESEIERLKAECSGGVDFFELIIKRYSENSLPKFSSDPSKGIYAGNTVTYAMLQWAKYMGFSEIFLLGMDGTYLAKTDSDINKRDHFCEDYITHSDTARFTKHKDSALGVRLSHRAYAAAQAHSQNDKSFKILNATRGGAVTAFERVEFDSIFN